MPKLYIPLILGTAREGRRSENAARFVYDIFTTYQNVETEFIDVRDSQLTATIAPWMEQPTTKPWQEKATRADGFVIVSPEYNHGYPGELKLFLDQALDEYSRKPVGIVGAGGIGGGTRMVEVLRTALIEMGMVPISTSTYFFKIKEAFNDNGTIKDPEQEGRVREMLDELIWYAKALKTAREQEPQNAN